MVKSRILRLKELLHVSAATLLHEWLPSLCLMTALAAVLCPVVLILGLKHGTVENLRQSLLLDPSNLEIRPRFSLQVDRRLLDEIRAIPGAGFLIPKTRSLGSASVELDFQSKRVEVDLFPTAPGDPLLEIHRSRQPGVEGIVLTESAASGLGVKIGGEVKLSLHRRSLQGVGETVSLMLPVRGILPAAATTLRAGYVELGLLSSVEEYRENLAVPRFGWKGPETQEAEPLFDGFLLRSESELSEEILARISVATGFLNHRKLDASSDLPGFADLLIGAKTALLFYNDELPQSMAAIRAAQGLAGDAGFDLYPWCKPREVSLEISPGEISPRRLHVLPQELQELGNHPEPVLVFPGPAQPGVVLLAQSPAGQGRMSCLVKTGDRSQKEVLVPALFAGMLRHLDERSLEWDEKTQRFLLGRRGFSSFRLYARDLASVRPVTERLAGMGIDCASESAKVARVLKFDQDLTTLFWLVAAFSLAGGSAALALSLYGAIERRRRDYAMLRVLGLPRCWLMLLPLVESLALVTGSFLLALGVYHLNAMVINRLFQQVDEGAAGFCYLPPLLQVAIFCSSLALAVCGALAAATRLVSMKLSEAIRHV